MGLFSRHHDDDYVSPFDVDDSPAYISIDSQTSQVDEPAYQQPKSGRISPDADRRRPAGKPAAPAPQTNQGRHGPERAMRPSICPTTAIHIAAATDTCSPRATANPAEPRSASADPGLPSSP
ncbi:hypothetical protein BBJK_02306 [Bifidobacterium bifidum LMG 13195]|uniref:Uncharacterized protein n=1 Tax=Bifidobacterium bifidum LMG 13195 TaxID=1207542 RepID=A0A286TE23_BIFBI|nr:hypothetical protein BBJK_02306 [Bifidobacterium bifidum LMG 13195]